MVKALPFTRWSASLHPSLSPSLLHAAATIFFLCVSRNVLAGRQLWRYRCDVFGSSSGGKSLRAQRRPFVRGRTSGLQMLHNKKKRGLPCGLIEEEHGFHRMIKYVVRCSPRIKTNIRIKMLLFVPHWGNVHNYSINTALYIYIWF